MKKLLALALASAMALDPVLGVEVPPLLLSSLEPQATRDRAMAEARARASNFLDVYKRQW